MKHCLECKKEFEPQKKKQKFCSAKCRVYFNRKKPIDKLLEEVEHDVPPEIALMVEKIFDKIDELSTKIEFRVPSNKANYGRFLRELPNEKEMVKEGLKIMAEEKKAEPAPKKKLTIRDMPSGLTFLQKLAWKNENGIK